MSVVGFVVGDEVETHTTSGLLGINVGNSWLVSVRTVGLDLTSGIVRVGLLLRVTQISLGRSELSAGLETRSSSFSLAESVSEVSCEAGLITSGGGDGEESGSNKSFHRNVF